MMPSAENGTTRVLNGVAVVWLLAIAAMLALTGCPGRGDGDGSAASAAPVKIGFLVKQPDEPWFQNEWKFAQQCADSFGFGLIAIGATDGERVLAAIDNLAAQGAKGFVICVPDVRLGPSIVAKARAQGLKVLSVDDRFVGADGLFITDVPHVGISASEIGRTVGRALHDEMRRRGWDPEETALCAATWEELQTTRERTDGAIAALVEAGFPPDNVFKAPQRVADIPGAFDAVNALLVRNAGVKRWLVCGNNDNAVLGAVRALEGRGYEASNVIAIGINGTDCIPEFEKEKPTGFHASILLSPKRHGFDTAEMMYRWVTEGTEPPRETYTKGILITRETFKRILAEQGML